VAAKFAPLVGDSSPRVVYQSVTVRPGELPQATPPRSGFRCVVVGALGEGKRQEEAILAMTELDRPGRATQLLVVGAGDSAYEQRLRRLIDEHGLGRRVFLMGHVPNPYPLVESADAVLICSRYEGFGRVTVEGMLAGKPVVGARSGGTAELIADGETGYLYTMGDHRELAAIVQRLAERPAEGRRVGERARIWARRRFTRERYASELLGLLEPLLRPHAPRGRGDRDRSRGQPK
jgi:glycosyltransferase involved in cell wall biosynthesis